MHKSIQAYTSQPLSYKSWHLSERGNRNYSGTASIAVLNRSQFHSRICITNLGKDVIRNIGWFSRKSFRKYFWLDLALKLSQNTFQSKILQSKLKVASWRILYANPQLWFILSWQCYYNVKLYEMNLQYIILGNALTKIIMVFRNCRITLT